MKKKNLFPMNRAQASPFAQQGAVLVTGLIFLVVLTLLGVSAMQTSSLEEKMAGNFRDRNLAFQASEAALRDAEKYVSIKSYIAFDTSCTNALCSKGSAPDWTLAATWSGAKVEVFNAWNSTVATIPLVNAQPAYFLEYAGQVKCPSCGGGWAESYKIVARGVGANANTQVVLEEVFRREL